MITALSPHPNGIFSAPPHVLSSVIAQGFDALSTYPDVLHVVFGILALCKNFVYESRSDVGTVAIVTP